MAQSLEAWMCLSRFLLHPVCFEMGSAVLRLIPGSGEKHLSSEVLWRVFLPWRGCGLR